MPACKVLFMKELYLSRYYEDVRNRTKSVRRLMRHFPHTKSLVSLDNESVKINLCSGCCMKSPSPQKDIRLPKSSADRLF